MEKGEKRKLEKAELKGAGKMLDMLWNGSYYEMGKEASKRIETEMIYYFGEDWPKDMYKLIEGRNRCIKPVKTLKELSK